MKSPFADFEIDDALARIDFATVHAWLTTTYWTPGISRQRVEHAARHSSLVLGAYRGTTQAGYLRVVSDRARFAYLSDVFVAEPFRKRGLAKAMVQFALSHPDHRHIDKWLLATQDAHAVYQQLGFTPLAKPDMFMELKPGSA